VAKLTLEYFGHDGVLDNNSVVGKHFTYGFYLRDA